MVHRNLLNALAVAQYVSYLIVGAMYYLLLAALMAFSGKVSVVTLSFLLLTLLLGGCASGLSLIAPRIAAALAALTVSPIMIVGIADFLSGSEAIGHQAAILILPSAAIIGVSICALYWSKGSLWSRQQQRGGKVVIGIFAALPALCATAMVPFWFSWVITN